MSRAPPHCSDNAWNLGADVVGGIPWIEFTDADMAEHVRICFDIAVEYDADVSMLLDDAGDPGLRTLEMMAVEAIAQELAGAGARPSRPGHAALPGALLRPAGSRC